MSEKTEEPTPKRERKAREDGDIAQSREITAFGVLLVAGVTTVFTAPTIIKRWKLYLERTYSESMFRSPADALNTVARDSLEEFMWMVGPVIVAAFAAALAFTYLQTGPIFAWTKVVPKLSNLNPAHGWQNIISKKKLVDLVKNLGKLSVMASVGVVLYRDALPRLLTAPRSGLRGAVGAWIAASVSVGKFLLAILMVFAIADLLWQRHTHRKKLMMSRDEVKREYKESEGDPQVKSERQRMHRELMAGAGIRRVREADAVVVNPTHVAVAIAYDASGDGAPTVISKGRGDVAATIRRLALRHEIPIVRDVPLARALVDVDLEAEIPEELYQAVAEVLKFVYSLRTEP